MVSRRELLERGSVLAGLLSLGVSLPSERATGTPTGSARGESPTSTDGDASKQAFATSHAVESAGFDDKPFWFDGPNGSAVRFASTSGERVVREGEAVPDGYVGWRIVDATVDRVESASWNGLTTLFLPTETVAERGFGTRYRLADVGPPVVGEFRRMNGNHTTERFFPVSFEQVSD